MSEGGHPGLPRLLAGLDAAVGWLDLAAHERIHGPLPRPAPAELIRAVAASGLRGRGGADFPTARKLEAVAGRRRVSAVVVNGSETEPASRKDALLLTRLPHLVLDGAVLAAQTVGSREVIVRVSEHATATLGALEGALAERHDRVDVRVVAGHGGYVSGEESAVMHELGGGPALPTFVPPRPFERGYRNRPTLIQNAETLAQLALIARFGPAWYRQLGTAADPGSALVTIGGGVAEPGVYELAFGTAMSDLLAAAGGPTDELRALLVGGYFGTWVAADAALSLRLAREELRSVGCALGSGVVIALTEASCGLHESARIMDFLARSSARQCGPCTYGLRAVADTMLAMADGTAGAGDVRRIGGWSADIRGRGACHHPDGAVRFAQSALTVFAPEIGTHRDGVCHGRPARLPLGREPALSAREPR